MNEPGAEEIQHHRSQKNKKPNWQIHNIQQSISMMVCVFACADYKKSKNQVDCKSGESKEKILPGTLVFIISMAKQRSKCFQDPKKKHSEGFGICVK